MANYSNILNSLDVNAAALATALSGQKKAEKRESSPLNMTEFKSADNKVTYVDFHARSLAAKQAQQVQQAPTQPEQSAAAENSESFPRNQFNPQPPFGKKPLTKAQLEQQMKPRVFPAPSSPGFSR